MKRKVKAKAADAPVLFVTTPEGALCDDCIPAELRARMGDDDVEVWEEGSGGWIAPVICKECKLSIPVYVDGEGAAIGEVLSEATPDQLRAVKLALALWIENPRDYAPDCSLDVEGLRRAREAQKVTLAAGWVLLNKLDSAYAVAAAEKEGTS